MADAYNYYFSAVFGRPISEPPPPGIHSIVPHLSNDLSVITLSTDEVYKVLSTLNPSKSPGPDEVTSRLLKDLALELAGPLTCLFNKSMASGQFPDKWKDANLTPVHKSGSKNLVSNYRGIALLSVVSKVLCFPESIITWFLIWTPYNMVFATTDPACVTQTIPYVHFLAFVKSTQFTWTWPKHLTESPIRNVCVNYDILAFETHFKAGLRIIWQIDDIVSLSRVWPLSGNQIRPVPHKVLLSGLSCFLFTSITLALTLSTYSLLHLFADDAKLCRAITTRIDCSILQVDISSVKTWCETLDMNFNPIKCKQLRITRKRNPVCATYHLGANVLTLNKEETWPGNNYVLQFILAGVTISWSKSKLQIEC